MEQIKKASAREVLDSRGNPTLEAEVLLSSGFFASAIVPSGASTGTHEAKELRDEDSKRYNGKGVLKAVNNVNTTISDAIEGMDPMRQKEIDKKMIEIDGTKNKSRLGANAILAVSIAISKVAALTRRTNLFQHFANITKKGFATLMPMPFFNIINGGVHANNNLDIQEFMLVPTGAERFSQALQIGAEVFHALGKILKEKKLSTSVGDEGGYAPLIKTHEEAIELILAAAEKAGHLSNVKIALDVAANEFYDSEKGIYNFSKSKKNTDEMIKFFEKLVQKYPIVSIEDPLGEDDFESWSRLNEVVGKNVQIVGDDLFVTNPERIQQGIEEEAANAVLIKPNQIGTITETITSIDLAQKAEMGIMISHRSGETEDTTIADLAVGLGSGQIKTGSLSRSERICKFNRLLKIEEYLAGKAEFYNKFI